MVCSTGMEKCVCILRSYASGYLLVFSGAHVINSFPVPVASFSPVRKLPNKG